MAVKRNQMAQALAKPQAVSVQRLTQVPQVATTSQYSEPNSQLDYGQSLINKAVSGQGFDPKGGWGVAAAQIATAGIGAWAQNRARKDIAEKEVNRQTQLSSLLTSKGYTPESAGAIASLTTPESGASLIGAFVNQDMAKNDPATQLSLQKTQAEIGKLNAEANKANKEARTAGIPSAPTGYTYNADGSLKAIKGGPADKANQPLSQDAAKTLTVAKDGISAINNIVGQFIDPKTKAFKQENFTGTTRSSKFLPTYLQGGKAQEFTAFQANLIDTIGRLRSGGAIGKEEEPRFLKMVPDFGDKPETFNAKIKQLQETFNSVGSAIDPNFIKSQNLQPPTGGQTTMPAQSGFKILNVRDK
tara:strand:- start:2836 stop:3912 length:1077 start_codon:yes stop_codon:yes gene_type:complete